jgi:hypothetical protein
LRKPSCNFSWTHLEKALRDGIFIVNEVTRSTHTGDGDHKLFAVYRNRLSAALVNQVPSVKAVVLFNYWSAGVIESARKFSMSYGIASTSSFSNQSVTRPPVTSYDSGYEHSLDRYVDVKLLLQDADKEASDTPATFAWASQADRSLFKSGSLRRK